MKRIAGKIVVIAAAFFGIGSAGGRQNPAAIADLLSLEQARQFMLEMINRDRATKGLKPVELDTVATAAAQKHAGEMAAYGFLSHYNREGKLPDQRYTEAGGTGRVQENVFLSTWDKGEVVVPIPQVKEPLFRKSELENVQAAFFNQIPPYDVHRRNILDPRHTHVGIGLVRTADEHAGAMATAQEFVARYLELDPIPTEAGVGSVIHIRGRIPAGMELYTVELGRDDLPMPRELPVLRKSGPYRTPDTFATYYSDHHEKQYRLKLDADGRFDAPVRLSDDDRPGLYFVRVRLKDRNGEKILASQRTVVVRTAGATAVGAAP